MATLRRSARSRRAPRSTGPVPAGDVLVKDGHVENAFVYLKEGLGDRVFAVPDRAGRRSTRRAASTLPRVAGAQICQAIAFCNSDPLLHNVHGTPQASSAWNCRAWARQGSRRTIRVDEPEVMVDVRCDVHPWMQAYSASSTHPYFAVTGPDGAFTLATCRRATTCVASWHERFGTREARVTLAPQGQVEATLTYAGGQ